MTMIEVERKRELAGGVEAVTTRLAQFGYHRCGTNIEIDTYYSRPDRDFMATVECLRVRERDGFSEITYKPPSTTNTHSAGHIIAKLETNVILSSAEQTPAANTLLDILGMVRLCQVEKTRTTFQHPAQPAITVALDQITDVGAFVETEVISLDAAKASLLLDETEQHLGLADYPVVKLPYRDLVLHHKDKQPAR